MKTALLILVVIVFAIYVSEPTISLKPFSVSFEKPYIPFAILFLAITIACYTLQYEDVGYKKGLKKGFELGYKNCREDVVKMITDGRKK